LKQEGKLYRDRRDRGDIVGEMWAIDERIRIVARSLPGRVQGKKKRKEKKWGCVRGGCADEEMNKQITYAGTCARVHTYTHTHTHTHTHITCCRLHTHSVVVQ
jgi:hypothetical protein